MGGQNSWLSSNIGIEEDLWLPHDSVHSMQEMPPNKGEIFYEQRSYVICSVYGQYTDNVLRKGIVQSLN